MSTAELKAPIPASVMKFDPALKSQIEALHVAYAHMLDDVDVDRWPQFFTEDGIYRITTLENVKAGLPIGIMRCIGRGMMEDRVKAFHTANIFEPHIYNHVSGPVEILSSEGGHHRTRSNFQIVRIMETGRTDLFATGHYRDVIVADAGGLRFKERVVVLDSRQLDILLVIPI